MSKDNCYDLKLVVTIHPSSFVHLLRCLHMAHKPLRISLRHILFTWAPAPVRPFLEATFQSWPQAETALRKAASVIAPQGYLRIYFEVRWQDEQCHRGRIDLTRLMALKATSPLADHVQRSLGFFAGRYRPDYWTQPQYEQALAEHLLHNPGDDQRAARLLDAYDVGGAKVA